MIPRKKLLMRRSRTRNKTDAAEGQNPIAFAGYFNHGSIRRAEGLSKVDSHILRSPFYFNGSGPPKHGGVGLRQALDRHAGDTVKIRTDRRGRADMKKGQISEGVVGRVDFPNRGIVQTEEGRVVVKNAIPGQKVRFVVNKKRGDRAEGRLLEVLAPSPLELRAPACSLFPDCGGCMYQTMSYEEQLAMKSAQVRALIEPVLREAGQVKSFCAEQTEAGACEGKASEVDCRYNGIEDGVSEADYRYDGVKGGVSETDYIYDGIKGSPREFAYRNKMEFSFGDEYKDGPLVLGLHKKGSTYDVLPVTDCAIVYEDFNRIVQTVLEYCRAQGFSYYHKMSHQGYLRHLLVRRAETTGEILVCLVTTSQEQHDFTPLGEKLRALSGYGSTSEEFSRRRENTSLDSILQGEIIGFLHMTNDSLADVVRSDESRLIFGRDHFYETILGLTFKITPFSFFQTNSKGAEVLYGTARDYIGSTKDMTVFDLYSGTGTIAQLIAPVARKVIGVEIVEEAVEAARENAKRNGLTNCEFIAGDVLKVIDEIPERPDFIILDPPRDGIHPKALSKIIGYGVDRLVYISCKPTSLARDLKAFLENGYRLERMSCVDLFCETQHCETVCLLSKFNVK